MKLHTPAVPQSRRGFSLIELVVVIAILATLSLIALPNLTDKLVRDQINEALPLADVAKGPVASAWSLKHLLPADNTAAGIPAPEKIVNTYVRSVAVENGAVHITFGNSANTILKDKVLTLRPAVVDDAPVVPVSWVCAKGKVPDQMTAKGEDRTTVPVKYLPLKCRDLKAK